MSTPVVTPSKEKQILDALPEKYTREQIFSMIKALQKDLEADEPGLSLKIKVHRHSVKHADLLVGLPMLYRTVCMGKYRPAVVEAILDARDEMELGSTKEVALENLIRRAVDEVNDIRGK